MKTNCTRAQAWALLREYNKDAFHLKHALTVEGVMRVFARKLGYGDEEEFWGIAGLLHDLDFERFRRNTAKNPRRSWRSAAFPPS